MINYICLQISNYLIKEKIITDKEKYIYSYLFSCVFEEIMFDFITLATGIIFHRLITSVLFIIITMPLRYFAGGYHASTPLRCTILSYGIMIIVVLFPQLSFEHSETIQAIIFFVCIAIIMIVSPVDTENKRFNISDKISLQKKARITVILICGIQLILWYNKSNQHTQTITLLSLIHI